jgi:hypothetical protein
LRKSKRAEKVYAVVDNNSSTTEDAGQPAAVTFVSKPSPTPQRVSPPTNIRVQPTSPLEGSSTKRRVIQWP